MKLKKSLLMITYFSLALVLPSFASFTVSCPSSSKIKVQRLVPGVPIYQWIGPSLTHQILPAIGMGGSKVGSFNSVVTPGQGPLMICYYSTNTTEKLINPIKGVAYLPAGVGSIGYSFLAMSCKVIGSNKVKCE